MFKGINVNHRNSSNTRIDWQTVKDNNNIQFVIIRAGYGANNIDKSFENNVSLLNRIGLPVGVSWSSLAYTTDMAMAEAELCISCIKKFRIEYPVSYVFDRESVENAVRHGKQLSRVEIDSIIRTFVNRIKEAGYYPMIYTNSDYRKNFFPSTLFDDIEVWYSKEGKHSDMPCGIWQYNSAGTIKGIVGNVGLNSTALDYKSIIKNMGMNNLRNVKGGK